ncbi:alpha/beta hydrolase [Actinokineospora fastidiosa]|uniref:alpha/beta hydrolase n=1 Tax=Actinokineospora fastidiosa TaxID=1816 RepID=UPI001670D509|nr:alpha/beta hydrolase [Actinokineospora fastidiosa]
MPRTRAAVLLVALTLLTGCTVHVTGVPTAGNVEHNGPAGPVPPGLERYYAQPLTWTDCRPLIHDDQSKATFGNPDARCAQLTVPLDYAKPEGRTITVGVLRIPASGERRGALVVNPGGPGVSGMVAAVSLAPRFTRTRLGESFDLVGFDPRGIGVSEPQIRCLTDAEADADRMEPAEDTVAEVEAENKDYAAKCAERSGGADVLANMGTRDVVRDMDVLRSALGEEKLTYLGYSYGTRIGTAYAEAFTGNVRAMILDGAVDPLEDPAQQAIGQAKGFDKALDAFFAQCTDCLIGDDDALTEAVEALEDNPLPVGSRALSASDVVTGIAAALYDDQTWPILQQALDGLAEGDGAQLLLLADLYLGRDQNGEYSNATDALIAVRCVDEPRITDRAEAERVADEIAEATEGSFINGTEPPLPALDVCAFWPAPNTSEPHQPQVDGLPQVLVISTTGDPATPYQAGVSLAKALDARLLTYDAVQHTAFLQRDPCVDDVGVAYLLDLTLPAEDLTCQG